MQQLDQGAGRGQAGAGPWGTGRQGRVVGCGRAHLGQEGRDEHEEDVVDEQHQQQQYGQMPLFSLLLPVLCPERV